MANENGRPPQEHGLEGEGSQEEPIADKSPTLYDLLFEPSLRKLTLPLIILWIYREYVYFGSLTLLPEVSNEFGKNFILVSISETVAVLMSYPIRMKIRRVNTFFTLTFIVTVAAIVCSVMTVPEECRLKG